MTYSERRLALADKIWKGIQKIQYDRKVSKDAVLHNLKQLKAQMGKQLKLIEKIAPSPLHKAGQLKGVRACMVMIDNKIAKVKEPIK